MNMILHGTLDLLVIGGGVYLLSRYRKTGESRWLNGLGTYIFVISFVFAVLAGTDAVLFPERRWRMYAVLWSGAGLGMALQLFHYRGWNRLRPVLTAAAFVIVANFCASSMQYFQKPIMYSHCRNALVRAVPEAAAISTGMTNAQRAALGPKLAAAVMHEDRFVRIGAMYALQYVPEMQSQVVPALALRLSSADDDEMHAMLPIFEKLAPGLAPDVLPFLKAKLQSLSPDSAYYYRLTDLVKKLSIIPGTAGGQ